MREIGDIETKTQHRRHGRLAHDRKRGAPRFRLLREATFMHHLPEELRCKKGPRC